MALSIVDVSHWQRPKDLDWKAAKDGGLVGVIIKHTQGVRGADPAAATHAEDTYDAGVPLRGAYHFGDGSGSGKDQALHFLGNVRAAYGNDRLLAGLLLMLDLEQNTPIMTMDQAEEFSSTVHAEMGRWPVLYMGKYGPTGDGADLPSDILSNCDLMLPKYGAAHDLSPHLPEGFAVPKDATSRGGFVRLWQFTDGTHHGGPFPGLGKVDQSMPIGLDTFEELAAWWGS